LFLARAALVFFQLLLDEFGQAVNLADGVQADVVPVQFPDLPLEESGQVLHQRIHFVLGAVPVLDGKGVERQVFDARLARGAHDGADGLDAVAMPLHARQAALFGPASVAIHDDGHVRGNGGLGLGT
jgi:hypothetical protein